MRNGLQKKIIANYINKLNNIMAHAWDFNASLSETDLVKQIVMENFLNLIKKSLTVMDVIPRSCLAKTICQTQREIQGIDSITAIGNNIMNAAENSAVLFADLTNKMKDLTMQSLNTMGNFAKNALDNVKNLTVASIVYQTCPRKVGDLLTALTDPLRI